MRNASLGPYVPADFSPPEYIVVVNALFYASLGVMLLAAFIAMLIKSWVREFDRGLQAMTIPEQRAKTREFRYLGMEHWKLQEMVAILPILIQISLLLFAIGLILFLFYISKPSFGVTTAIFGIGAIYYAITTTISVFVTSSPFHSPLSRVFGRLYRLVHAYFCPSIDHFLLPNMDTTPATHLGRFGRRIQISLQKFRPYSEKEFEKPIAAVTIDEYQLSTAVSALQRIHDSVPNSPHSQLIHQSVWQVAGSSALRIRPLFKLPSCVLDRGSNEGYFSRLSPAGVVGLGSVFVRMRDARHKGRIDAVGHICSNPSYSQEPRAQLVHALFKLLPDNFFPDERHALLDPAYINNIICRDVLLYRALPDDPLLCTLRNALLCKALRNAPNNFRNNFLPDNFRDIKLFFTNLRNSLYKIILTIVFAIESILNECSNLPYDSTLYITIFLTYTITIGIPLCLVLGLPLSLVIAVVTTPFHRAFAVLYNLLLCDSTFSPYINDSYINDSLEDGFFTTSDYSYSFYGFNKASRDARHYAPFFKLFTHLFESLILVCALFRNAVQDPSLNNSLNNSLDNKSILEALFHKAPFRSALRLLFLGNPHINTMMTQGRIMRAHLELQEPKDLINILQRNPPQDEDSIWLLNTLSVLHCDGLVLLPITKICLTILLHQAPRWNQKIPPNIMLIEAVVTLAAISCSSNETYQRKMLANSHQHPWLLLNLRDPEVISSMIENINDSSRKELISLLLLVIHGLSLWGSKALAVQYLAIIRAKRDFLLCASILVGIPPALANDVFFAIGGSLRVPQALGLFNNYDLLLGPSQPPDPECFAALLLLSKNLEPWVKQQMTWHPKIVLGNPWLQFIANAITRCDIPDEFGMVFDPFHDHRVHNMIAALSLLPYSEERTVIHWRDRESLFLASFLPLREIAISSLALHHYLKTVISCSNPPPPSHYLSGAVHALFSPILPDDYLSKGWEILHMFVDGFKTLSIEWQQTFAEAFFTVSHRPLLSKNGQNGPPVAELTGILTWEYFCKEGKEPEFMERVFSGLDWMALAWSLHLSQQSSTTTTTVLVQWAGQPPGLSKPPVDEEFVLQVLCRLLDAAPYYCILPITPKLHEFVEWFDGPRLIRYQNMVSASVERAKQECERSYKFQKDNCIWYL